ncbi:hypothetical protein GCM10020229_58260 [Kitasatospora albolonga]
MQWARHPPSRAGAREDSDVGTQQGLRPGRGRGTQARSGRAGRDEAVAAFAAAGSLEELKQAKVAHTGDRSPLSLANREIGALPPQAKAAAGKLIGQARGAVNQALAKRQVELEAERDARVLVEEAVGRHAAVRPHPRAAPGTR